MKSEEVTRILENAIRIGKGVIRYGSVASYIPELAKADKNKLGICLYTIDGNQFETGNTEDRFTIQSISKVMALCLALETFGAEFVFDHVGVEPSGEAFNSLVELDNRSNRPFNPMINSGAITVASLLVNHYSIEDMQKYMQDVCEDPEIAIDEAVFQSEMATCARNKAIAYLLKSKDIIDTDVEESVTFYTKMCSMSVNARDLAMFEAKGYRMEKCVAVDQFCQTVHVETVVLLSHKKADSYIHIDVEFGEGEGKIPVDSIAKRAEAYKPKEKVTYKMIKEYIEAKYGFKVHTAYIAEVKRDLGLPMYDAPNAVEELKQPRKHPTAEKVEAIKDALKYFGVI